MEYKVSPTYFMWSPVNVPSIRLWKANPNGSPKLPRGVFSPVFYYPIWGIVEKQKFISVGLSKYVDFWKVGIAQSASYEMKMKPYMLSIGKIYCCIY